MLGITLGFGLYAIYYGTNMINTQRGTISLVREIEEKEFSGYTTSLARTPTSASEKQQHDIGANPAFAWSRHGYHAILEPTALAHLSIGQRDLSPYYYRLTAMSLYYQLFQNEIANPLKLATGNFDLSFVLIYIFPLLIIAFCYGLLSGEKERGIYPLLRIQAITVRTLLLYRLLFYFIMLTGLAMALSLLGCLAVGVFFSVETLFWVLTILTYHLFWFGLLFLIVGLNRNSSFNAITAVGCWLLFLLIIPGVLNLALTAAYPLDSAALAGIVRRTGFSNENDDRESRKVISEYITYLPELFQGDSTFQPNLLAKAYAAYTQLNDVKFHKQVDEYQTHVKSRNVMADHFDVVNPAVNAQNAFTGIAETDLRTYLNFQESIRQLHQQIVAFYIPRLYRNDSIAIDDYAKRPVYQPVQTQNKWQVVVLRQLQLAGSGIVLFLIGFFLCGRRTS